MIELIFATANEHKVNELRSVLAERLRVRSMAEIGHTEELPETSDTLKGNALQKASALADVLEMDCFAEDTGLEVDCLDGAPGVHSARYAGETRNAKANMDKLLNAMQGRSDRGAQFRAVIALIIDGATYCFDGIVRGHIAEVAKGEGGFGYDPVFIPEGYDKSFAELPASTKDALSHRGRAALKMMDFLEEYAKCKNPR